MGLFTGLATAQVSTRLPDPIDGTADFLVNSIRYKDNRNGGFRVVSDLTCVRSVEGGNQKGDHVQYTIFGGDYFHKELKALILTLAGVEPSEEDAIVDMMCPKDDPAYAKMDDLTRMNKAWEMIGNQATAMGDDGKPTASGMFDGQVIVRLRTITKPAKPTGKFIKNAAGELVEEVGKPFTNHYPIAQIPFSDVAGDLDERDIVRIFGSVAKFSELLNG